MAGPDLVRFCNNPHCERCDEHLRPGDVLTKAGRELCSGCHEEVAVHQARPRAPRLPAAARPVARDPDEPRPSSRPVRPRT